MPDSTFITRVAIENFKSITACDVRLGPFTFLVGPNGAGKSNFLDSLSFVKDGLVHSLEFAIRQRGSLQNLWHYPHHSGDNLMVSLELRLPSQVEAAYSFKIKDVASTGRGWRWELVEEECRVGSHYFRLQDGKIDSSLGLMPAPASDRLFLVLASGNPVFREVFDALIDMQFYQLQPRSIPDINTYDPQQRLLADGSNLASVLFYADANAKARIEEFLRVVLPTVRKVSVEPVVVELAHSDTAQGGVDRNGNKIALVFHQKVGNTIALFGPTQMSEGTLRTLAILTALYQMDPIRNLRPTLTAIEDVEAAVHPAELAVLYDALEEASLTTQVIVSSQSPELLDRKDLRADSILAVSADEGVTRLGPPDQACRTALDEHHLTAGELLRIGQLSPLKSAPPPAAALSPSR
jgi:predicted ATPase